MRTIGKTRDSIISLFVQNEAELAITLHGYFNSPHEGYAVLLEEIEEAEFELFNIKKKLYEMWEYTKRNQENSSHFLISCISMRAINELIQVAAVCEKIEKSKEKWKKGENQ